MTASATQDQQDRIAALEDQLGAALGELSGLSARMARIEGSEQRPRPVPVRRPAEVAPASASETPAAHPRPALGDLIGGRVLAWLGGVATLLGTVLFLVLAVSHGWIGREARVLAAGAVALMTLLGGVWLHERRGRTEAARTLVAAATAGLFATLIVAGGVYELLPGPVAVIASMLVGAAASTLADRWRARAIGGLGLTGALSSAVLVGAAGEPLSIVMLAVAASCAMWLAARRHWGWLALSTVILCAPQWAMWVLTEGRAGWQQAPVLVAFAMLGLSGSLLAARRDPEEGPGLGAAGALALSALCSAVIGYVALRAASGTVAACLWLAALAGVHLVAGFWPRLAVRFARGLRGPLLAISVVLIDVAFGLAFHGQTLALGWSAGAVVFAWLTRRARATGNLRELCQLGVGAQIALALVRALIEAPPSALTGGASPLAGLLSIAAVAAASLLCGQLSSEGHPAPAAALSAVGLLSIACLTASTLSGGALTAAWAFEALALAQLAARRGEAVSGAAAVGFAAGGLIYSITVVAPPSALTGGGVAMWPATVSFGALSVLGARTAVLHRPGSGRRDWSLLAAGGCLLYLASLATVSTLPAGQTMLSALWGVAGLLTLLAGLRLRSAAARTAGLALLLATVAKVFLYDLATLTSLARVASFMVLGMLLLAAAFAYQRLRPPPLPDLRMAGQSEV